MGFAPFTSWPCRSQGLNLTAGRPAGLVGAGPSAGADPYLLDLFFQGQGSYHADPHQLSARAGEHACGAEAAAALQGAVGLAAGPFGLPYALGAVHHGMRHASAPAADAPALPSAKQARSMPFAARRAGLGHGRI